MEIIITKAKKAIFDKNYINIKIFNIYNKIENFNFLKKINNILLFLSFLLFL